MSNDIFMCQMHNTTWCTNLTSGKIGLLQDPYDQHLSWVLDDKGELTICSSNWNVIM